MNKASVLLITLLLMVVWAVPVPAAVITPADSSPTGAAQTGIQTPAPNAGTVGSAQGGVQPISPDKIKSKTQALENWAIEMMAPLIHLISKLSLLAAVLFISVAAFTGRLFGKAFAIIGCAILSMAIFTNIVPITETIQYFGQWLGQ